MLNTLKPFEQFAEQDFLDAVDRVPSLLYAAIDRIINSPFDLSNAYVGHSGGKDSVLINHIGQLACLKSGRPSFPVVHNTKPPGVPNAVHELTILFLYEQPMSILYTPLEKLSQLGFKTQIDGTRRDEYDRSNGRAVDVVINGEQVSRKDMPMYIDKGLFDLQFIYPIVDWSDIEVWAAIYSLGIPFSKEYLL